MTAENDPTNPFVRFATANRDRYSAAADLAILLKRALSQNAISWEEAAAACGVEGIVVYDLMQGRVDGFDVEKIRGMAAAVEKAAAEQRGRKSMTEVNKTQKDVRGILRWVAAHDFMSDADGNTVELSRWEAFVGKQSVGHVSRRSRKDRTLCWRWSVYQCNPGPISSGELPSQEEAMEAIEKRIRKWFKQAGMPLVA